MSKELLASPTTSGSPMSEKAVLLMGLNGRRKREGEREGGGGREGGEVE